MQKPNIDKATKKTKISRKDLKDSQIILKLLGTAKPHWRSFLLALFFILALSAIEIISPNIVRIAIDDNIQKVAKGLMGKSVALNHIKFLGLLFLGLMLIQFVFSYINTLILSSTGQKIIFELRQKLFAHIQKLPVPYFDKVPVGVLVTRTTNDIDAINDLFTNVLIGLIREIVVMLSIIVIMFSLNVKMALVSMSMMPIVFIAAKLFKKKSRTVYNELRNKIASINIFLSENIMGIKIIQLFGMSQSKRNEYNKLSEEYKNVSNKRTMLNSLFAPFMNFISTFAKALLIWFGAKEVAGLTLEIGMLYLFIDYLSKLFGPIITITGMYNTLQYSIVASDRVFKLLDEKEENDSQKLIPKNLIGKIEFKHVWFAYNDDNWVLKDVSFVINSGEKIAFVGATGSGKSTIINLMCSFYENQKGEILIDDINIKDIPKKQLRENIGLVLQDVQLFAGDIKTNIKLYNKKITQQQVEEAAKYVGADKFINKLSDGYENRVYFGGNTISNGERQLLSFARAIVTNPTILVLDEATSSIDTETEQLIQDALKKISEGRTTIAIAHRLSTIKNSTRIIVINNGELCEEGTHEELLEMQGIYHSLYTLQFAL